MRERRWTQRMCSNAPRLRVKREQRIVAEPWEREPGKMRLRAPQRQRWQRLAEVRKGPVRFVCMFDLLGWRPWPGRRDFCTTPWHVSRFLRKLRGFCHVVRTSLLVKRLLIEFSSCRLHSHSVAVLASCDQAKRRSATTKRMSSVLRQHLVWDKAPLRRQSGCTRAQLQPCSPSRQRTLVFVLSRLTRHTSEQNGSHGNRLCFCLRP